MMSNLYVFIGWIVFKIQLWAAHISLKLYLDTVEYYRLFQSCLSQDVLHNREDLCRKADDIEDLANEE